MRVGDWKILAHLSGPDLKPGADLRSDEMRAIKTAELTKFELYNLRKDIGEKNDLAVAKPARLKEMSTKLRKIYEEVRDESPVWPDWDWPRYEGKRIQAHRKDQAEKKKQ